MALQEMDECIKTLQTWKDDIQTVLARIALEPDLDECKRLFQELPSHVLFSLKQLAGFIHVVQLGLVAVCEQQHPIYGGMVQSANELQDFAVVLLNLMGEEN